jgi:hypothetical protein
MPKNSSLKALNVCGTYIDQEWPRGLAYQDSFMQKCSEFSEQYVIQPFMKLLQSIPSFEKLVISKEYTFDGIITPTTIYFKNTPNVLQNTGSQKNTTNSSNWNVNLNDNLKLNKNEKPLILNENLNVNCLNNTNYLNINTINLWNKNKYSGSSSSSSSNSSERPLKFEDMGVTQLTKEQRKSLHKSQKLAEKEMTKKAKAKMKGKKKIDESSESEDSSDDDGNKDNK